MNKILLIFLATVLVGCSNNANNQQSNSDIKQENEVSEVSDTTIPQEDPKDLNESSQVTESSEKTIEFMENHPFTFNNLYNIDDGEKYITITRPNNTDKKENKELAIISLVKLNTDLDPNFVTSESYYSLTGRVELLEKLDEGIYKLRIVDVHPGSAQEPGFKEKQLEEYSKITLTEDEKNAIPDGDEFIYFTSGTFIPEEYRNGTDLENKYKPSDETVEAYNNTEHSWEFVKLDLEEGRAYGSILYNLDKDTAYAEWSNVGFEAISWESVYGEEKRNK